MSQAIPQAALPPAAGAVNGAGAKGLVRAAPDRAGAAARWTALAIAAATAVSALLLAAHLNPYLGDYGDDAEFLILGQGLARGQGYAWVNSPPPAGAWGPSGSEGGGPWPAHNRYPPGYPALLAAAMVVTSTHADAQTAIVPAKLVTAATFLLSIGVLWPLARRRLPAPSAAAAVALYALNPFAIRFATQVMSDAPFILAALAALAWADRLAGVRGQGSGVREGRAENPALSTQYSGLWDWIVLGVLLAAASYVRSVGVVLAGGVLLWAWWRTRRAGRTRWAVAALTTYAALMLPWWIRDATLAGGWRYLEELLAARYQSPAEGVAGPGDLVARAADNALFVLDKPGVYGAAGFAAAGAAALAVGLGYWRAVRQAGGAAEWAAVLLILAVLIWPIKSGRYLLPVLPLVGIYFIGGTPSLQGRRAWPRVVAAGGVLAVVLFEAAYSARDAAGNLRALAAAGGGGAAGYYQDRPEWAHYLQAADWLRGNAGRDDVALARRHFALYVYSGRHTDKYRFDVTEDELAYLLAGTARKFVVEDAFDYLRGDFAPLPAALRARGGDLVLRFQTAEPAVRVWELVRPPGACCAPRA